MIETMGYVLLVMYAVFSLFIVFLLATRKAHFANQLRDLDFKHPQEYMRGVEEGKIQPASYHNELVESLCEKESS